MDFSKAIALPAGTVLHPTYPGAPDTLEYRKVRDGANGWARELPAGGYVEDATVDDLIQSGRFWIRALPDDMDVAKREVVETLASGASPAPPEPLWCVNVLGPDDVHACRDIADAFRYALWLNLAYLRLYEDLPPHGFAVRAVVVPWPGTPESHAADLASRDRDDPRWMADWRKAIRDLAHEVLG